MRSRRSRVSAPAAADATLVQRGITTTTRGSFSYHALLESLLVEGRTEAGGPQTQPGSCLYGGLSLRVQLFRGLKEAPPVKPMGVREEGTKRIKKRQSQSESHQGKVECTNRSLKSILTKMSQELHLDWTIPASDFMEHLNLCLAVSLKGQPLPITQLLLHEDMVLERLGNFPLGTIPASDFMEHLNLCLAVSLKGQPLPITQFLLHEDMMLEIPNDNSTDNMTMALELQCSLMVETDSKNSLGKVTMWKCSNGTMKDISDSSGRQNSMLNSIMDMVSSSSTQRESLLMKNETVPERDIMEHLNFCLAVSLKGQPSPITQFLFHEDTKTRCGKG
ncbi:hypothetical protein STEG23_006493 [Scotinomys teguina]